MRLLRSIRNGLAAALLACIGLPAWATVPSIHDAWTSSQSKTATITATAGTNRMQVIAVMSELGSAADCTVTALTVGGVTATLVRADVQISGALAVCTSLWRIMDANIIASGALSITETNAVPTGRFEVAWATYKDVNQSTPVDNVNGAGFDATGGVTTNTTLTAASGDAIAIAAAITSQASDTDTWGNSWTERLGQLFGLATAITGTVADKSTAYTAPTVDFSTTGRTRTISAAVFNGTSAALDVTDVDTDEIITSTQTNVVITGTGFGASQGAGSVQLVDGSITSTCTIDSWSDTSIQADMVLGNVRFGSKALKVTNNAASNDSINVTINAPAGQLYHDLTGGLATLTWDANNTPSRLTVKTSPYDPTSGLHTTSQIWMTGKTGGNDPTIYDNGAVQFDDDTTQFKWRWHDGSVWSSEITWDIGGVGPVFEGPEVN